MFVPSSLKICVLVLWDFFFLFVFITELPSMEFDLHLTGTSVILHLWLIYSVFCTSYLSDQTKHVVMVWWLLIHPVQCCGHGVIWTLPERLEHDSALSESFFFTCLSDFTKLNAEMPASYETKSEIPYSFLILMCPQAPAGLQYPSSFYLNSLLWSKA